MIEAEGWKWWDKGGKYDNLPLRHHEVNERKWVRENIWSGGLFIDVGANSGVWAITLSNHFERVVAVEPHPVNLEVLRENIWLNGIKNIQIAPIAAWKEECWLPLNTPNAGIHDYNSEIIATDREILGAEVIRVQAKPLDSLFLAPSFIKIDVEGAEVEVLQGLVKTIRLCEPVVLVEIHTAGLVAPTTEVLAQAGLTQYEDLAGGPPLHRVFKPVK